MSALATLTTDLAAQLGMGQSNGTELLATLKATAFKGQVSDAQMTALMVVARQYRLNPWTKEIYAFPDRQNGIVPVVGVDGWSRIINSHAEFDGMDFQQDDESCTCVIYRKDRSHPIKVTEWMSECKRDAGPWKTHPKRMLRHKAMIQCARLAFGFSGIYDEDEATRINEAVTGVEHTDERVAIVERADGAASRGTAAYVEFWQGISAEHRKVIGKQAHDAFKEKAKAADANTIDAETGEIHG